MARYSANACVNASCVNMFNIDYANVYKDRPHSNNKTPTKPMSSLSTRHLQRVAMDGTLVELDYVMANY